VKPQLAEDIAARFNQSAQITEQDVARAVTIRDGLCHKLNTVFSQCDVIVIPTTPGIAPLLDASPESLGEFRKQLLSLTAIAGLAGLPQLHLPLFSFQGAPCGVSLIGRKGEDFALMSWAEQLIGKE
jgi:Asp-tRNA(Asn)/Glu-tRNA(Gln) amidotransferase A subunit family amidase